MNSATCNRTLSTTILRAESGSQGLDTVKTECYFLMYLMAQRALMTMTTIEGKMKWSKIN